MIKKTKNKNSEELDTGNGSQSIMLEEYQALHSDYLHQRSEGVTRVNFYIAAMSVLLGGALVFVSSNNPLVLTYVREVLLAATVILFTIGLDVYNYLVQRDLATDRAIRGMARVRHYFIKLDPDLKSHFINNIYDTPSGYLIAKSSGMRRTTEVILGFLTGTALAVLSSYFLATSIIYILIGIGGGAVVTLLLEFKARRMLDKALEKAEKDIRFNNVSTK
jgi:hypothetical protein